MSTQPAPLATAAPVDPLRPIVVYHVAAMGDWKTVVSEQLPVLADAGFGSDRDFVRVTFLGGPFDLMWFMKAAEAAGVAVVIVNMSDNTDHYETFAMLEIERMARVEKVTRRILYLHTKGVSAPGNAHKRRWRVLMEEFVVRRWREAVERMAVGGYDTAGVGWMEHGEQHYSGNFWIADPGHLQQLPDFVGYHRAKGLVRYSCEMWIGARRGTRALELWHSNQQLWQDWYDLRGHTANLTRLPDPGVIGYPWKRRVDQDGVESGPGGPSPHDLAKLLAARPLLVVLTACSRPQNLTAVGYSLRPLQQYFRVCWLIVIDSDKTNIPIVARAVPPFLRECINVISAPGDGTGIPQKNAGIEYATKNLADGWLCVVDDDNAVHPGYAPATAGSIAQTPTAAVFVFGQVHADGTHRLDAGPVEWSKIDAASVLVRVSAIGDARFRPHPGAIGDDYQFIAQLWERAPERFRFIHRAVTYYNKLPNWTWTPHCPVPLYQELWEFNELVGEVSLRLPECGIIMEIGSLYGGTLWHWLHMGVVDKVVSIDLPPRPPDPWYCEVLYGDYLTHCRDQWDKWADERGVELRAIRGDSHDLITRDYAVNTLGGKLVDVLYIDGDHSTAGVLADFRNYAPFVKPGGMVVLHDVTGISDVRAAWDAIRATRRHMQIGSPNGWGIGIVFVDAPEQIV